MLEKTSAFERQFTYHYSLEIDPSRRDEAMSFVGDSVSKKVCKGKDTRSDMRDYGIIYIYKYQIPNEPSAFKVRVDDQRCRELGL